MDLSFEAGVGFVVRNGVESLLVGALLWELQSGLYLSISSVDVRLTTTVSVRKLFVLLRFIWITSPSALRENEQFQ